MCVRSPASRSRISRSAPIAPPSTPARTTRTRTSPKWSSGTYGLDGVALRRADLLDPARGEVEQVVELRPVERSTLGGRLNLDQPAVARHDDVHVDLGGRVLLVVQVEPRLAFHHAHGDRRH